MGDHREISPSVKALIQDRSGKYLVIRRSMTSKSGGGNWDLPGGKLDPGENPETALRRETAEETGLDVAVIKPVGTARSDLPDRIITYEIYSCRVPGSAPEVTLSDEHTEYRWMTREELLGCDICGQFKRPFEDSPGTDARCRTRKACCPGHDKKAERR